MLLDLGETKQAEGVFRRVTELDPRDGEAQVHLGALLRGLGAHEEARVVLARAVDLLPDSPHAHFHLGMACKAGGDPAAAQESLEAAVTLDPNAAETREALGLLLLDANRGGDAAREFRHALRITGPRAESYNNLGAALRIGERAVEAIDAFERALAMNPQVVEAHLNLGDLFVERGDWSAAARRYAEGMRHHPDSTVFTDRLLFALQHVCDWTRFDELCARRLSQLRRDPRDGGAPFSLLSIPSSAAEQLVCATAMARRLEQRVRAARIAAPWRFPAGDRGRLRVGYLSGDFYEHVMAYLTAPLFELHDRRSIEVFAYSYGPDDGSAMRARIAGAVEHFVDLRELTDREAAERIHADGIHVLMDANGYTQRARSAITAFRPAPVQVNYLGYPGTLGANYIDYVIADRFVFAQRDSSHFTERPVLMPACYAPNDPRRVLGATPARSALGLPEAAVVFCCFNQTFKVLPEVFAGWMHILRAVPDSVLWLLEGNAAASANLRCEAARRGIDAARLVIAPRVSPAEYLARLPAADLFLDTFPYNAHTTAADALWAGVPVLTRAGDTFASRVAGSMLTAVGLPELITRRPEEYESAAIRLGRSSDERAALNAKLATARTAAPLFDMPGYVRHLEAAYRRMDEIRRAGAAPQPIVL